MDSFSFETEPFFVQSPVLASNSKLFRKHSIAARVGGLFCTANLEIRQSVPQRPQAYPFSSEQTFVDHALLSL